jgi:hypothetical protein
VDRRAVRGWRASGPLLLSVSATAWPARRPPARPSPLRAAVREAVTVEVPLPRNDTDRPSTLTPVVTNEYWSGRSGGGGAAPGGRHVPLRVRAARP